MGTLLIVEDNLPLAQCLSMELETEGFVPEIATDGSQAIARLRQPEPIDLVMIDWDLPDFSGLELLQIMRKNNHNQPVIMLTAHDSVDHKVLALKSGADDYLAKPFSFDELQARILALLRRCSSEASSREALVEAEGIDETTAQEKTSTIALINVLSMREREVLQYLGEGQSNAEIAQSLCITQETVKSHVKSLLCKLKAKDRTHAVVLSFRAGLL
jgi:DNA-binding response OmpR family regulator